MSIMTPKDKRPFALLDHQELVERIRGHRTNHAKYSNESGGVLTETAQLLTEYNIRREENRIDEQVNTPMKPSFIGYDTAMHDNVSGKNKVPLLELLEVLDGKSWNPDAPIREGYDREFQDLNRSNDAFEQGWQVVKMPLVRDSIKEDEEGNFSAIFQDRDDPDKQYPMRTDNYQGLNVRLIDESDSSNAPGKVAARGHFRPWDRIHAGDVNTHPDYRRKGMMTGIYDLVNEIARRKSKRLTTYPGNLSGDSAPFWAKHLGLPYEGDEYHSAHSKFQIDHKGKLLEWPEEGVFE